MPENKDPEFVPARYIGSHVVDLARTGRKWLNVDGSRRTDLVLHNGDTVMMPAEEVLGKTLFNDRITGQQFHLGIGRVVKPEHQDTPEDQLSRLGYEFHDGRPDFEAIEIPVVDSPPKRSKQSKAAPGSLVIDERQVVRAEVK